MARKTLEERLAEAKAKQRLLQAEVNKKNRKERTHLLILHGVQVENALKKLGKPLNMIETLSPEKLQVLETCYKNALSAYFADCTSEALDEIIVDNDNNESSPNNQA